MTKQIVEINCTGSCLFNPGPGGYAALIFQNGQENIITGGYKHTTNQRMEIRAAYEAIKSLLPGSNIHLYSDSEYVVKGINKWISGWKKKNWKAKSKKKVANLDLWKKLDIELQKHSIQAFHVKGHSGDHYNDRCDSMAKQAAQKANLPDDSEYIAKITKTKQAA